MTTEPAAWIGAITALVTAVISLLVAFGVDITEDQKVALLAVLAAAAPVVASLVTRGRVSPVE